MSEPPTIEEIVKRAQDLGPHERAEFVRRACGSNETILSRVLIALNEADTQTRSWRDLDEGDETAGDAPLEGTRLGPYRFLRKLGSGGMGDVWLAERADDEYQQRVAIKLVRAGLFSAQVQGRLRMERQILASLQHPNIARLLDGGRANDGTPYLVLEYIDGEPIDVYCERRRLSLEARIQLVKQICSTVHYAHQNLVVHRDLKPNNILITQQGEPKLLDFGIAKLLDTRQAPSTLAVTHYGYRVMTPSHASPEQIRGETITTASDIYVLGVLLYELLSGCKPFQFEGNSLLEVERAVCEQEPAAPSVAFRRAIHETPETAADIAACRSTFAGRLERCLQGDLDNIVMRAMQKEAARRYGSAEQLSADLERHLHGLPVIATGDTWMYRSTKFVRRHLLAVAAAAGAVLMLAVFATVTYVQSQRIAQERDIATSQRARAEQVSSFLVELFELSDPSKSRGNQITARELLDIGARRVSVGLAEQPETRTTLLATIGRVYKSLGLYSDSVAMLERALKSRIEIHGPQHMEVAAAMVTLADALLEQGQHERAEEMLSQALQMQQQLGGAGSLALTPTLIAQGKLAQDQGHLDAAQKLYEDALGLYREHGQERTSPAASVLNELAGLHSYRGQYAEAATLYRTALDIDRQALGQDHPQVAMYLHNLAVTLHLRGDLEQAEPLYVESVQLLGRVLGERHPQTLDATSNFGRFLHRKGDLRRAEELLARTVESNRSVRGERHAYVGHDLVSLAIVRLDKGDYKAAEADLSAALSIYKEALPPDHPYVASALANVGRAQLEQGQLKKAEETLRHAIEIGEEFLTAQSPQLAAMKSSLGRALLAQNRNAEAEPLLRDSVPLLMKSLGERAPMTLRTQEAIAQLDTAH